MARSLPACGEPLLINEVLQLSNADGKSVRVVGRLDQHNVHDCSGIVADSQSGKQLAVDTSLIEPFDAKIGSLFQMIGELETDSPGCVRLRTRVVRCVDGLDLKLYQQALELQRVYLNKRKQDCKQDT